MLGQAVIKLKSGQLKIEAVSHDSDWDTIVWDRFDVVVNMACNPRYMREPYEAAIDFDRMLVERLRNTHCKYVMLSSRRVYGRSAAGPAAELTQPAPDDNYGCNKLATEHHVQSVLGARCTILRLANIFAFEPGRHTFFGIALGSLKREGKVVLDVNPFVRRDFLHVEDFAAMLSRVLENVPGGILNIGSGRATEIGRIALWLIEGFGRGEMVALTPNERDSFELDISKFEAIYGRFKPAKDIQARCIEIGGRLRDE